MSHLDTFAALDARLMRNDKPVPSRKLANNTYAQRRDADTIAIRLHATDVVTHHRDGRIVLDSGGWNTVTTKQRMNAFTPQMIQVHSIKGRWFVTHRSSLKTWSDGTLFSGPDYDNSVPFMDGMIFTMLDGTAYSCKDFEVTGIDYDLVTNQSSHNAQIEKLIDRTLRTLTKDRLAALRGCQEQTCGMCVRIVHPDTVGTVYEIFSYRKTTTVGEVMGDRQHLIDHLLDKAISLDLLKHSSALRNPSEMRCLHDDLAKTDLRRYLRQMLLVGAVSQKGARRDLVSA